MFVVLLFSLHELTKCASKIQLSAPLVKKKFSDYTLQGAALLRIMRQPATTQFSAHKDCEQKTNEFTFFLRRHPHQTLALLTFSWADRGSLATVIHERFAI